MTPAARLFSPLKRLQRRPGGSGPLAPAVILKEIWAAAQISGLEKGEKNCSSSFCNIRGNVIDGEKEGTAVKPPSLSSPTDLQPCRAVGFLVQLGRRRAESAVKTWAGGTLATLAGAANLGSWCRVRRPGVCACVKPCVDARWRAASSLELQPDTVEVF